MSSAAFVLLPTFLSHRKYRKTGTHTCLETKRHNTTDNLSGCMFLLEEHNRSSYGHNTRRCHNILKKQACTHLHDICTGTNLLYFRLLCLLCRCADYPKKNKIKG